MERSLTKETIFVMCRMEIEYGTDEARDDAINMALGLPRRSGVGCGGGGVFRVEPIDSRLCPPCFQPNWDKEIDNVG